MFNALRYSRELEEAGFTRQQAEATINAFFQFMDHSFATKEDLRTEIAGVRSEIAKLTMRMEHKFVVQKKNLLLHLYLLQAASVVFTVGAIFGLLKLAL